MQDFVTPADPVIYPGTGFVINNPNDVTLVTTGNVKETDTQVPIRGGSAVNIVTPMKPVSAFDMSSDGRAVEAFEAYSSVFTQYSFGDLIPHNAVLLNLDGNFVKGSDFVTPASLIVDGTAEGIVINTIHDTVYKASGMVIPE